MPKIDRKVGDRNYLIRDIPHEVDHILNTLATMRGIRKWEIVREAMVEYAKNHRDNIAKLASLRVKPVKLKSSEEESST